MLLLIITSKNKLAKEFNLVYQHFLSTTFTISTKDE